MGNSCGSMGATWRYGSKRSGIGPNWYVGSPSPRGRGHCAPEGFQPLRTHAFRRLWHRDWRRSMSKTSCRAVMATDERSGPWMQSETSLGPSNVGRMAASWKRTSRASSILHLDASFGNPSHRTVSVGAWMPLLRNDSQYPVRYSLGAVMLHCFSSFRSSTVPALLASGHRHCAGSPGSPSPNYSAGCGQSHVPSTRCN